MLENISLKLKDDLAEIFKWIFTRIGAKKIDEGDIFLNDRSGQRGESLVGY